MVSVYLAGLLFAIYLFAIYFAIHIPLQLSLSKLMTYINVKLFEIDPLTLYYYSRRSVLY